jgi:hypothetical protein
MMFLALINLPTTWLSVALGHQPPTPRRRPLTAHLEPGHIHFADAQDEPYWEPSRRRAKRTCLYLLAPVAAWPSYGLTSHAGNLMSCWPQADGRQIYPFVYSNNAAAEVFSRMTVDMMWVCPMSAKCMHRRHCATSTSKYAVAFEQHV